MWAEVDQGPGPSPRSRRAGPAAGVVRRGLPEPVAAELRQVVGQEQARRLGPRLAHAVGDYERDRYHEALRALKPVAAAAPTVPAVRELLGLTLYRMGRWKAAIAELEAFHELTGSYDQHPVLADCHRALGHWDAVEGLWDELRRASPGADLVNEGRIVAAGALADRGDLSGAIRLLERSPATRKGGGRSALRVRYALADVYERAGDMTRARQLLRVIADQDPDFVDVRERLAALS